MLRIDYLYYKFASAIDKFSIKNSLFRGLRIVLGKFKDKDYSRAAKQYKLLKKRYLPQAVGNREWESKEKTANPQNIYFMWLQGIENAPDIVKACYVSLKEHCGDRNVILVTQDNISELVSLPKYIIEKYKSGAITRVHFSDIVRCKLLISGGGGTGLTVRFSLQMRNCLMNVKNTA